MRKLITIDNYEEWIAYRMKGGIGASEVSALLGFDEYKSRVELFWDKVGFISKPFLSIKADYGKATEDLSSKIWMCWQDDFETTYRNYSQNKIIRTCHKFGPFDLMINTKIPNMISSPDREFTDPQKGYLELKDTSYMAMKVWKDGVNPSYRIQNKVQIMLGDYKYGELFLIVDRANTAFLYQHNRDGIIAPATETRKAVKEKELIAYVQKFWETVITAREVSELKRKAGIEHDYKTVEECEGMLMELEPEPDCTNAYEEFMNEKYYSIGRPLIEIPGTEEHEKLAEEFIKNHEGVKKSKEKLQFTRNKIIAECKSGCRIVLPGKNHYIQVREGKTQTLITVK